MTVSHLRIGLRAGLAAACAVSLVACATLPPALGGAQQASADRYNMQQAQQVQSVELGTVVSVRSVTISPDSGTTSAGSGIGAIMGGFAGHEVGQGKGRTAATVALALAGAVAGNKVAQGAYKTAGQAVTIKLDSGRVVAVTQAADVSLRAGQRVQLIGGSGGWGWNNQPARVVPL